MTLGTHTIITGHKVSYESSIRGTPAINLVKKEHNMKYAFCPINYQKQQRY